MTGILGVITGAEVARRCRKISSKADPLLCSISMFTSAPFLYVAIMVAQESITATYVSDETICPQQTALQTIVGGLKFVAELVPFHYLLTVANA